MARDKPNFRCSICAKKGDKKQVFMNRKAIAAHVTRKHKKTFKETDFVMTSAKPIPKQTPYYQKSKAKSQDLQSRRNRISDPTDPNKPNYKCLVKGCGRIFGGKQAISAHMTHKHKRTITDKLYTFTAEPAEPSLYERQTGKPTEIKPKRKYTKRKAPVGTGVDVSLGKATMEDGYIMLPIVLRIPFSLGIPQILQLQE